MSTPHDDQALVTHHTDQPCPGWCQRPHGHRYRFGLHDTRPAAFHRLHTLDLTPTDPRRPANVTFRFKIGATVVPWTVSLANATNRGKIRGLVEIAVGDTLTDQRCAITHLAGSAGAPAVTQLNNAMSAVGQINTTEDLSTDKTITLSVQHASASASLDARLHAAWLTRQR